MGETVITEDQKMYIISLVDRCISMHREINNSYCKYPDKMNNNLCECNCDECFDAYYNELRAKMLKKAGMEE